jgi:competence protein ComEC
MMLVSIVIGKIFVATQTPSLIFLDVGQGDAAVYIDSKCVVVVDAFSNVESYLRTHGRIHIDYLFLTHSDLDHTKEANKLIENMKVRHVVTSPYQRIEGIETQTIYQFPKTYICGELKINILGPTYSMFDDNDDSLIILFEFLEVKILFTGDASKNREKQFLSSINGPIDVLKIGHHGSNTSTDPELLYALKPKFGIISTSKNNRYGMPHKEVLTSLNYFNVQYFITSRDGSIKMTVIEGDIIWETYPP